MRQRPRLESAVTARAARMPFPDAAPYREAAAFYRAAVSLGLLPGAVAVRWADALIERDPAPPPALYDVSLAPPGDALAVADALAPLAGGPAGTAESPAVVRALLDLVWRDVRAGRRRLADAVAVVHRMSGAMAVEEPLRWEMVALEDDYSLAAKGIAGDLPAVTGIVRDWLARFDGATDALLGDGG